MKTWVFSILIIGALASNWEGKWTVNNSPCNPKSCCCPQNGTIMSMAQDPNNKSQILVNATWAPSLICTALGWNNKLVPFPWNANDISSFQTDKKYIGNRGVAFSVSVTEVEEYLIANISTNQQSVAGGSYCPFIVLNTPTWDGDWYVLQNCDPSKCCCPSSNRISIASDPANSSQVLVTANWQDKNNVCSNLGWNSSKPAIFPWSNAYQYNNYSPVNYTGAKGLSFSVASVYYRNQTLMSDIYMNQSSAGGSNTCFLRINNSPPKWEKQWLVLNSCNPNTCCCPAQNTTISLSADPTNSSQFLISGAWSNNSVCQNLGWNSKNPVAFPLAPGSLALDNKAYQYNGPKGVTFTANSSQLANETYHAYFKLDQSKVGGSSTCNFEINNHPPSWAGDWMSLYICGVLDCCCLVPSREFTIDFDPTNSSQLIVHGAYVSNNKACKNMGWNNKTSLIWPWGNFDLSVDGTTRSFVDAKGVSYSLSMTYLRNNTISGDLIMNQLSVGGPDYCRIPINNHYKWDIED